MNNRWACTAAMVLAAITSSPGASSKEIDGEAPLSALRFDINGDKRIDAHEVDVLKLHVASRAFRDLDNDPLDGIIQESEVRKMEAAAFAATQRPGVIALASKIKLQLIEGNGSVPIEEVVVPDLTNIEDDIEAAEGLLDPECALKDRLFIRRDKIDMSIYNKKLGVNEKSGASLVIDRDYVAEVTSATIDAAGAFVLFRNTCMEWDPEVKPAETFVSGYSLATYTALSGELVAQDDGSDESSARFGIDGQLELQGGLFRYQYLTAGGYVQTDFRGEGLAFGAEATWQPLDERIHMGIARRDNPYLVWYWTPIVRLDALSVSDPGHTGLEEQDYAWLGADIELTALIWPAQFNDRLYAKAAASLYWDLAGSESTQLYTAGIYYNLDDTGYSSISTEYRYGTDRTILEHEESLRTSLNFKY